MKLAQVFSQNILPNPKLLDFSGRASRAEFWKTALGLLMLTAGVHLGLLSGALFVLMFITLDASEFGQAMLLGAGIAGGTIYAFFELYVIFVGSRILIKRMQDRDIDAKILVFALALLQVLAFVINILSKTVLPNIIEQIGEVAPPQTLPVLSVIVIGSTLYLFVQCFLKGTNGENRFGPDCVEASKN